MGEDIEWLTFLTRHASHAVVERTGPASLSCTSEFFLSPACAGGAVPVDIAVAVEVTASPWNTDTAAVFSGAGARAAPRLPRFGTIMNIVTWQLSSLQLAIAPHKIAMSDVRWDRVRRREHGGLVGGEECCRRRMQLGRVKNCNTPHTAEILRYPRPTGISPVCFLFDLCSFTSPVSS